MWIHLLSLNLIDGAGGEVPPPPADELELVHGWIGDKRKRKQYDFLNPEFHQREEEPEEQEERAIVVKAGKPVQRTNDAALVIPKPQIARARDVLPRPDDAIQALIIGNLIKSSMIVPDLVIEPIIEDDDDAIVHLLFDMV